MKAPKPTDPAYLRTKLPLTIGLVTLAILVGGFFSWSVLSNIAGAVIAPGKVEVSQDRQVVQHQDGGIVAEIFVTEGSHVNARDIMFRLNNTDLLSEFSIMKDQLQEAQIQRARLTADHDNKEEILFPQELIDAATKDPELYKLIEDEKRLFIARRNTLTQSLEQLQKQIAQSRSQIVGIDAQSDANRRQMELVISENNDQKNLLKKGLVQTTRVMSLAREEARLAGLIAELAANRAETENRISELELEVLRLQASRREEVISDMKTINFRQLELSERYNALKARISRLNVRAPTSGTVLELQIQTPGAVIRPAETLAFVVPQDKPLIITAQIPPVNIDEVYPGQPVTAMFAAFSSRTTPQLEGKISLISPDAIQDKNTGMYYYRAEVSISAKELKRLEQPILPGMPVQIFAKTADRSPLSYLLRPFTDYFVRAFRES